MKKLSDKEMKTVQKSQVDVVLDPETAHLYLILTEDGKQVKHVSEKVDAKAVNSDKRFSQYVNVLGKECYAGNFYFEVQIKGKTKCNVGVARESVNRQDAVPLSPEHGFWAVTLRNVNTLKAAASPPVSIKVKKPLQKLGVYVDYDKKLVSFYDLTNKLKLYSFKECVFAGKKLYPYLCPCLNDEGKNSAPMIILT